MEKQSRLSGQHRTRDRRTIKQWAENRGGMPARSQDTGELLIISSDDTGVDLITWDEFFSTMDAEDLVFIYEDLSDDTSVCAMVPVQDRTQEREGLHA